MTRGVYIAPDRIVLSLAGFEAGPATPMDGKLFDSAWPSTALVLARGLYIDPTPSNGPPNYPAYTTASSLHVIGIPTFPFPIVFTAITVGTTAFSYAAGAFSVDGWVIYPDQVQKARRTLVDGGVTYYSQESFFWMVLKG
ncbi:hypothetical protein [Aurantimonas endophytica]|uniref:Uncharacterized protein n=1 Tax=Aurantimonas endophytica TaxID=1522175 RepID=A0A7W6MML2_9HYPH|nr:hypothetical protein [Aurantimonas endophytica]MBB4000975.1 hypothetical protein [Aurantimonas endophytica]MCO6403366.1 hypothetical protein [Aurantimonas endophytica]